MKVLSITIQLTGGRSCCQLPLSTKFYNNFLPICGKIPTFTAKITKECRKPLIPKGQRLFPFVINMQRTTSFFDLSQNIFYIPKTKPFVGKINPQSLTDSIRNPISIIKQVDIFMLLRASNPTQTLNNLFCRINIARFLLNDPHDRKRYEANQKVSINVILKRDIYRSCFQYSRFFYSNFQNRKSKTLVAKSFKGIFFLKFFHFYVQ